MACKSRKMNERHKKRGLPQMKVHAMRNLTKCSKSPDINPSSESQNVLNLLLLNNLVYEHESNEILI